MTRTATGPVRASETTQAVQNAAGAHRPCTQRASPAPGASQLPPGLLQPFFLADPRVTGSFQAPAAGSSSRVPQQSSGVCWGSPPQPLALNPANGRQAEVRVSWPPKVTQEPPFLPLPSPPTPSRDGGDKTVEGAWLWEP